MEPDKDGSFLALWSWNVLLFDNETISLLTASLLALQPPGLFAKHPEHYSCFKN